MISKQNHPDTFWSNLGQTNLVSPRCSGRSGCITLLFPWQKKTTDINGRCIWSHEDFLIDTPGFFKGGKTSWRSYMMFYQKMFGEKMIQPWNGPLVFFLLIESCSQPFLGENSRGFSRTEAPSAVWNRKHLQLRAAVVFDQLVEPLMSRILGEESHPKGE